MKELKFDITLDAGADYTLDVSYTDDDDEPVDMSGWIVEAEIRESSASYDALPFQTSADETGFHLSLCAEHTAGLGYTRGIWDMFSTSPNRETRTKLLDGRVTILPDTARRWR